MKTHRTLGLDIGSTWIRLTTGGSPCERHQVYAAAVQIIPSDLRRPAIGAEPDDDIASAVARALRRGLAGLVQTAGLEADPNRRVTAVVPATWPGPRRRQILDTIGRLGYPRAELATAAEAVAAHYARTHELSDGQTAAVLDIGGRTTSCAVLRMVDGAPVIVGAPLGLELGGTDLDNAVLDVLTDRAGRRSILAIGSGADPLSADLRDGCRQIREALSEHHAVSARIVLDDETITEELTRSDFERSVQALVDEPVRLLERVAESVDVDVSTAILIGGVASTPLVARRITERSDWALHVPTHPDLEAAFAAAEYAVTDRTARAPSVGSAATSRKWFGVGTLGAGRRATLGRFVAPRVAVVGTLCALASAAAYPVSDHLLGGTQAAPPAAVGPRSLPSAYDPVTPGSIAVIEPAHSRPAKPVPASPHRRPAAAHKAAKDGHASIRRPPVVAQSSPGHASTGSPPPTDTRSTTTGTRSTTTGTRSTTTGTKSTTTGTRRRTPSRPETSFRPPLPGRFGGGHSGTPIRR